MSDHTFARISGLSTAMMAGSGLTRDNDVCGRKYDLLMEGEYAQSGLSDVAVNLRGNIRRLLSHAQLPVSVFTHGRCFQHLFTQLCAERGVDPYSAEFLDDPEAQREINREMDNWMLGESHRQPFIGYVTSFSDVAGFAAMPLRTPDSQIEAFVGSLVIEAWTLFESLSEDLWEAALNSHPRILGELKGLPRSLFKERQGMASRQPAPESDLRLSFNDLQQSNFDVSSLLGTILKQSDKIGFRSLGDIRASYHRAFSQQHKSIDDILDDHGLQYAAAVRNLLIHKRGLVDNEFRKQTALLTDIPKIEIGKPFPISGQLCAELADSCRVCACWLVNAVHFWIIGHP